jgi:hypothetical protein
MAGKTTQRGYGTVHQRERKRWAARVERGEVSCARCGRPILPGELFDLGHDDHDRSRYVGAEHRRCNRATSSRRRKHADPNLVQFTSRKW